MPPPPVCRPKIPVAASASSWIRLLCPSTPTVAFLAILCLVQEPYLEGGPACWRWFTSAGRWSLRRDEPLAAPEGASGVDL